MEEQMKRSIPEAGPDARVSRSRIAVGRRCRAGVGRDGTQLGSVAQDPGQLGPSGARAKAAGQARSGGGTRGHSGAGTVAAACRECTAEDGQRNIEKGGGVFCEGVVVKFA